MKLVLATTVFALAVLNMESQIRPHESLTNLTYSELYEARDRYLDVAVRLSANYIYGFEWQFLCGDDTDCQKRSTDVWVEFVDDDDLCKGSTGKLRKGSSKNVDNRAQVIFIGRLAAGSFGHFGLYKYQFVGTCVEKVENRKPLN